jgi:hypothetical protein
MFIDIFKDDLDKLGVENVNTKCLYTAVTILYLFCGQKAIDGSLKCYVDRVKTRMSNLNTEKRKPYIVSQIDKVHKNILSTNNRKRTVFFMMITNNELPHPTNSNREKAFFPGHVFVIDKQFLPNQEEPIFKLYQSYINKYTLQNFSKSLNVRKRNNSPNVNNDENDKNDKNMDYDYERMKEFMIRLSRFIKSSTWDSENVRFWEDFTLVNAREFKGFPILGHIHFCYNYLPAIRCKKGLLQLLSQKMENNDIDEKYKYTVKNILLKNKNIDNSSNNSKSNDKVRQL